MRKLLHTLFTLTLVFIFSQAKAQVTLSPIDPGPYTPGSTIAATFTLGTDCIATTNTFELYLSDAAGNFVSTTRIGFYTGFYNTFVNGNIPPGTPPGLGYRVRILSTSTGLFSPPSAPFEIRSGTAVQASVTSFPTLGTTNEVFGYCTGKPTVSFDFTNTSTASSTVTGTVKNEVTGANEPNLVFNPTPPDPSLAATLANYTVVITARLNGTVGTRAYMVINNNINNSFGTSGGNIVCLPGGFLQFPVDITEIGIKNNYPGTIYTVNWGDSNGVPELFTFCTLKTAFVRHEYLTSSCGSPVYNSGSGPKYNVFGINIVATNPFCGEIGGPLSTYVKVIKKPENSFTSPIAACTGSQVTFINTSLAGQSEANTPVCIDNDVKYNWYVDGVKILSNQPRSTNFQYTFPTPKVYSITLESVTSGQCNGVSVTKTICIQNPPQPIFDFGGAATTSCAPYTIQAVDRSIIDNNCNTDNTYNWVVTPSTGVTFNPTDKNPVFTFTIPGTYSVLLQIRTASCGVVSTPEPQKIILIDGTPTATLSPALRLCALATLQFDATPGPTQTIFTGTQLDLPDTYTWSVTESDGSPLAVGDYSFEGSNLNTKYPSIKFNQYKTYKVTVVHKNSCGNVSASQLITFISSPVPTITVNPEPICYDAKANLTGSISNTNYISYRWSTLPDGGTFINDNTLTPTYTPSPADLSRLRATVTLTVSTGLNGDCASVIATKDIIINPNNTGVNTQQTICTGTAPVYTITSSVPGSTFAWTAANADGNAGTFTVSGSGTTIGEILNTTSPTQNAVVIYTITPTAPNGCVGVPFTLTVTVTPRPVITTPVPDKIICSNQQSAVHVDSNIPTGFTWSSAVSGTVTGNTQNTVATTPLSATFTINDLLINNGTQQATVVYTITPYSAGGCSGTPVTVTVHVDPAVTISNAGPDESICNLDHYTLKGNAAVVGTGTWLLTSGQTGVTITPANGENAQVAGLLGGQSYTFSWTITAPGTCAPTTDEVTITVNTPTVPGTTVTTNPTLVCSGSNSGTITLTGSTGSVLNWQSSIDGGANWVDIAGTANTLTYTYTNLTIPTQFRAVVQNGQCIAGFSTATAITVTPPTTIAKAGPDQELCAKTTVTLAAASTPAAGETGMWTRTAGPATVTITDPSNPNTDVTGLVAGQNYTFTWTITGNSPCGPTNDDVIITDYLPLTNTISSTSTEVCYNQVIAITGSTPTGGNGTYSYVWEVSTDGGTNWNVIPGQTGKDLSYQLQITSGFRRSVTSGPCPLVSNIITIIAQQPITNNTIAVGQSICTGDVPVALTGNIPAGSDGNFNYQWQFSEDNGATWANVNGAVSLNYAPLALTTTTMYRRLVSTVACNGALQSTSNAITIIVRPNAKAEYAFTTDKGCAPFIIDANNIRAVAYPDRNATYTWYADNVQIGTGITFPGYTIAATDQAVTIKLVTAPSQGCQPDEFSHVFSTNQSVAASYTQSATQGCGPLIINFVNTSTSLTNATFTWDFGNGVTSSQTMPPPVTFQPDPTGKDITYTVTMTATTTCGNTSTTSTVFVKAKPRSVFSPSKTVGCSPMLVTFSNTSPGETNTYSYDFGDGSPLVTTTDKSSVQHTYLTTVVKDFVVTMTAQNECGSDQSSYTIRVSPNTVTAELVVNADQKVGCAPFTVTFYNNSKGASSFIYDFGDGSTLVTRSAPEVITHTFTTAGTFNVTLTASNGCSEISTSESITVLPQPLAQFNADNVLGCPGLVVQFRNTSTGGISYLWDFGDGTTSQETAPQHVYAGTQEFYTVSLTATNSLGCTYTTTLNQYIHIVQPPVAQFNVLPSTLISIPNYTFKFEDESTNTPTIWLWDFGDKTTSVLKNPSHTYQDVGTYTVTLKVTNQQGCFTTTFKEVTIAGVPGYLYVPNSFMPGSATSELRVFGAKGSGIKDWTMSIFNKWGQQLWQTTKLDEGRPVESWDGTFNSVPVPQGVYFWKIDVEFINGSAWKGMTYDSSAPKKTGVIHLLR